LASQQLTMFVSDYEQGCDLRDRAAYRALGAITAAICFCREGKTKDALHILTTAIERYEQANRELQRIKKGEN
jgi:hypothetical protein